MMQCGSGGGVQGSGSSGGRTATVLWGPVGRTTVCLPAPWRVQHPWRGPRGPTADGKARRLRQEAVASWQPCDACSRPCSATRSH